jgi:UDPglucose--hexose-1-phosphate uridylyltransferase
LNGTMKTGLIKQISKSMRQKSEFRQNLVSGNWILISPARGKRPDEFKEKTKRKHYPKHDCPFESTDKDLTLFCYPTDKECEIQVRSNKYPAVTPTDRKASISRVLGLFPIIPGYGHHEVIVTKDHDNNFPNLKRKEAESLFYLLQERYKTLAKDKNTAYVSFFHNWGEKAGASIYHPHYQIITLPVVPSGIRDSLNGSLKYYKRNKKCVHCVQLEWERRQNKRIVCKNKNAIALAPFASKEPFEMRVFPRKHIPYFEVTPKAVLKDVANLLQEVLKKLEKSLSYPDYNFFIHTSPAQNKNHYAYYHWHIEIFPRTNISAGFELGTDVEINPLDPDEAAAFLRKK